MALMLCNIEGFTQQNKTPFLERTVTITFADEDMETALKKISKAAGFTFSYSSSLINEKEIVRATFTNRTVREILDHLFKGSIAYRERGKYVILLRTREEASARSQTQVVSGYVIDEATGEKLKNVSVYDPQSLSSAITNEYGFFQIEIKNPTSDEIRLAVNKSQYTDTLVVVPQGPKSLLNIPIRFDKEKIQVLADSVGSKFMRMWNNIIRGSQEAVNMENISDTLHRKAQVSAVPFIGSNGGLSGNVINDYSFNFFGGYSLGNRKFEIGGLFNANRGNVTGFQLAGLANGVMGKVNGFQLAGLANLSGDSVDGVQIAGLANVGFKSSKGLAVAGLANFTNGPQRGVYVAGLLNYSSEQSGPVHVAGLFNITAADLYSGAQVAGLANFASGDVRGAQVSGLINIAPKNMTGLQLSGLINVARDVHGIQVGLLNVAKSVRGVPIGLLSVVGKGYHKIEISADEIFYNNIAFRTGVRQFYNILTVGARPETYEQEQTMWTFGYGVGTAPRLTNWLYLNFDLTSNQIVYGQLEKLNLLNKFYTGFDFQITKGFSITAGVTLNGHISDATYPHYPELFADYTPTVIEERSISTDLNLKMWWGGKVGIRFF